ncbi:MAG TPA: GMC family oxidoreductase N-terminal domain-containing protein [Candidatus Polarisedimenticolia bacterium]|nr:GMC family oxidoreductase N-terminal domain-containing protein [Candidatus Polarisedimenticolia bacterium]
MTIRPGPRATPPTGWSRRERRALAALAETFVEGTPDVIERRVNLAAEAAVRGLDPTQLAQFRLVLRLLGTRLGTLLLTGRPRAFANLPISAREAVLRGWLGSPIGVLRAGAHAYRKLLTSIAYADPGESGANPLLAGMGYVRDEPPVTSELTPIEPTIVARASDVDQGPISLDADVVIVGSGAGGGVVAAALAEAGRSVVVLEAGPFVNEASMPSDELDGYIRLYLNRGLLSTWDGSVTLLAGSGVGGGTLVNWMTSIDAPLEVRREWATEHGLDGFDGAEWDADIATVSGELAIQPSAPIPPKDSAIVRGSAVLGWEAGSTMRDGGPCDDCGTCSFGCRRGSKRSGLRVHLARAHAAGARIVPRVRVLRVLVEGGRAVGVAGLAVVVGEAGEPIPLAPGSVEVRTRPIEVRAEQVVLTAGALRTPAIVEASGFSHPAAGRHLRIHPVPVVAGMFDESIDAWRGPLQSVRSIQFVTGDTNRNGYVIESAPGHPGLIALALPWTGRARHGELMSRARTFGPFIAVTRDGGEGTVRLTRAGRVRLDYRLDRRGIATLRHALQTEARLARAAGANEILALGAPGAFFDARAHGSSAERAFEAFVDGLASFDFGPNRGTVFSAHQMGSLRMGASARDHAADERGHVRRDTGGAVVPGLYVADTSTFPTGLGVNPMLTVMAMARRVSRTILAEG